MTPYEWLELMVFVVGLFVVADGLGAYRWVKQQLFLRKIRKTFSRLDDIEQG